MTTELPEGDSVERLMGRYVDGSLEAFDELYRRVSPRLFGYLMRLTRHRERAEDLLQVTFGKVHRARGTYLRGAPVMPWLLAIARRSFYDAERARRSRREDLTRKGDVPETVQPEEGLPIDVSDGLAQALAALPVRYREAIEMTKFASLSMSEAAVSLGTTESAVKLRVHRGYKLLREALAEFRRE